jgi:hypothetical protein
MSENKSPVMGSWRGEETDSKSAHKTTRATI